MATAPRVPTIDETAAGLISAWETQYGVAVSILPKAFLRVSAKILAALFVTLFKYAAYNYLQQFAETADLAETEVLGRAISPLQALASERGIGAPDPATQAELNMEITVLVQTGTIQPGEQVIGQDNNITYIFTEPVPLSAATVTGRIRAAADQVGGDGSGVAGNLPIGAALVFANPRENVSRIGTVQSVVVTAADGETESAYRDRVIDAYQKQPEGGAPADYEKWAQAVEGIIEAYPYKGDPGEVDIYCEADPASSGSPDGIPTPAQQAAVLAAVDAVNPISDWVNIYPISRTGFTLKIQGLTAADLAGCKAAVDSAVAALYAGFEPYIPGLSVGTRRDMVTEAEATATAAAVIRTFEGSYAAIYQLLTATMDRTPSYILSEGEKAKGVTLYL
jgi:uncharacterized phage protein gp47/JayE